MDDAKGFSCIPIVGATKLIQLEENLKATGVSLTDEHIRRLDEVSAIVLGFPHDFLMKMALSKIISAGFMTR